MGFAMCRLASWLEQVPSNCLGSAVSTRHMLGGRALSGSCVLGPVIRAHSEIRTPEAEAFGHCEVQPWLVGQGRTGP